MSALTPNTRLVSISQIKPKLTNESIVWNGSRWVASITSGISNELPTSFGQPFRGGYYIGDVPGFFLVLSSKHAGEHTDQWKTEGTTTNSPSSHSNGYVNMVFDVSGAGLSTAEHPLGYAVSNMFSHFIIDSSSFWYIPSIEELETIYANITYVPAGEGFSPSVFVSSTEISPTQVLGINFDTGVRVNINKTAVSKTRAIRRIAK